MLKRLPRAGKEERVEGVIWKYLGKHLWEEANEHLRKLKYKSIYITDT